jgi:hypothetical protein
VANFGINLDLRLNGQSAVDRAIRGAKALEDIVRRINDKPLNLANIGGAARLERLGDARKKVIELAKDINKGTKSVGKTEVAIRDTISAFSELAANTEKGTGVFNEFTAVVQKAEKELNDIARATENARRAQKGLMSLEDREAQLERRANLLRTLRTKKKLKEEEARARKKNSDAIDRENKKLERQRKIDERAEKRRAGRIATNFAAGAGFPLLFGGGPGAVIGGTLGAFGGFGGSVLGGALGQQLDKLGQAALNTGEVFNKLTKNVNQLIPKLGTSTQPGFAGTAEFLVSQGRGSEVATAARNAFEDAYGAGALKRFQELGRTSREFDQVMAELGVQLQDFISGPLRGFLEIIKRFTGIGGGQSPDEKARSRFQGEAEARNPRISQLQSLPQRSFAEEQELNQLLAERNGFLLLAEDYTKRINGETSKSVTLNKILRDVLKQQASIQEKETDLVRTRLTARRDDFARAEGILAIEKAQNDVNNARKALNEENGRVNKDTNLILELRNDLKEKEGILDRARLNNANNVLTVERAINAEVSSLQQATISLFQQLGGVQLGMLDMSSSEEQSFERRQTGLQLESKLRLKTLELQREQALVGKIEGEVRDGINEKFDLAVKLEKRATELQLERNRQAEILRQNREQEIKDNRELLRLESERNAKLQIRSMDFERKAELSTAGFGFFGQSEDFQEQTLGRSAAQLEAYNEQIGKLQQRIQKLRNEKVDPDVILTQQFKLEDLEAVRDSYEKLRPSIDAAAIAQARFTDAMAVTVPVTDSLFDSLIAVVEGTKTAEQAFADFLRSIASMLVDAAKQMIATYIAIGVARMFAGMGGGQQLDIQGSNVTEVLQSGNLYDPANSVFARANGGPVGAGRPYLVGERGPELFVPGAQGNIVPNNAMGGANVTVNVDASGSSVEGNADQASQLGKAIGIAVQQELVKQKRPGGLLAR